MHVVLVTQLSDVSGVAPVSRHRPQYVGRLPGHLHAQQWQLTVAWAAGRTWQPGAVKPCLGAQLATVEPAKKSAGIG